jgi:hypothetical protein
LGRTRKIALLGSHEATLKWAPWDDPSWELWGHASSRGWYPKPPSRYFDLHRKECWTKSNQKGEKYVRWLAQNTVPIYMQDRYKEVPASIRYPIERVLAENRPYFTNHAAYMIALALMEGVTHIGFFGVNYGKSTSLGADCEYGTQRGSCEYWMGVAEARGVKLILPQGSTLLADPLELYGYASHDAEGLLVESYRQRTWIKPTTPVTGPKLPNGVAKPPKQVMAEMAREREEYPRPAGQLDMDNYDHVVPTQKEA